MRGVSHGRSDRHYLYGIAAEASLSEVPVTRAAVYVYTRCRSVFICLCVEQVGRQGILTLRRPMGPLRSRNGFHVCAVR